MFLSRFKELKQAVEECECTTRAGGVDPADALKMIHFLLHEVKNQSGIVYVIGNGGSAGIASHFSTDLLKSLEIPSMTLVDSNQLTCFANDYGYEFVYSTPLEMLLKPMDLLIAISSSGRSKNILNACETAQKRKTPIITLSGFSQDTPLRKMGDLNFWLNYSDYGIVETGHFFLLHTVVDTYKKKNSDHYSLSSLSYAT
jgi:D-sedoheptulose 7-phosphate isomerase